MAYRLGVDVGGTNTDAAILEPVQCESVWNIGLRF